MSLLERLRAEIVQNGPLTVAQYMHRCLHDPRDGYYATRPALGETGDFITAPLVSQMFGEIVGLWAAEVWTRLGSPGRVRLVEVGPGDGTLMSDVLRAAKVAPGFLDAAEVWLVETSEPLRARQRERLGELHWAGDLSEVPHGAPLIVIANELLDCLAARQFVQTNDGWVERLVGLDAGGELTFALSAPAPEGAMIMEVSAAQEAFASELGALLRREKGAALLIDYGRSEPGFGDTFQALSRHTKVDPLAAPGEADLTVYADFPAVRAAAEAEGCATEIAPQGLFLRRLGIEHRAAALARMKPERGDVLERQLKRLIDPAEMGDLFKAACIHYPAQPTPPGFEDITEDEA